VEIPATACGVKGGLPWDFLGKDGTFVGYIHVFAKERPFARGKVPLPMPVYFRELLTDLDG
jgi:hypothetical protein